MYFAKYIDMFCFDNFPKNEIVLEISSRKFLFILKGQYRDADGRETGYR